MKALAKATAAVLVLALVSGCNAKPAEQAPPPTAQTLSDMPPPLVPAMPLPDNAIDNAVAKLDGIVADLMKKSGIPGMAPGHSFGISGSTRAASCTRDSCQPR